MSEKLIDLCLRKLEEILNAPQAVKANLMKTDGKLIINYLNYKKTENQTKSGILQSHVVIGKMIAESKGEFKEYIKKYVPDIVIPQKLLPPKKLSDKEKLAKLKKEYEKLDEEALKAEILQEKDWKEKKKIADEHRQKIKEFKKKLNQK